MRKAYFRRVMAVMAILASIPSHATAQTYYDGIRIGWQYTRQQFATPGVYARAKKLSDGRLALVYSNGAGVYIRTKAPEDTAWGTPRLVASEADHFNYTNAELIELQNGTLMYAWNARPKSTDYHYKIMVKFSYDGGTSWQDEREIFFAGTAFNDGVWEPAMVQLPSGELQIYFANEYYMANNAQKISMRRSFDNGLTWAVDETVCYREGTRDGMPVPLYLQNGKGLVFAIEDNGLSGTFKPVIIHTDVADNWASGSVSGNSPHRWTALAADEQLAAGIYAGAPYLIQLSTGETLLSVQSGEGRDESGSENHALMQVYVGNDEARSFTARSTPFPFTNDAAPKALWNSLCQIDDETVMAVSSISNLTQDNGVWTCTGRIMRPLKAARLQTASRQWDDVGSELFIGAESQAHATIKAMWDNQRLYFRFDVADSQTLVNSGSAYLWDTDGIEIYLDPRKAGKASRSLVTGLYKVLVNVAGATLCSQSNGGAWNTWSPNMDYSVERNGTAGYQVEVSIPWSELGGLPADGDLAMFFKLHNYDGGSSVIHENLSGSNPDQPCTWMRCTLSADGPTAISQPQRPSARLRLPAVLRQNEPVTLSADGTLRKAEVMDAVSGQLLQTATGKAGTCVVQPLRRRGPVLLRLHWADGRQETHRLLVR